MAGDRRVELIFEGTVSLSEREVWPDGDAPDDWTAADVVVVIKNAGGLHSVLRDWNLDSALELAVVADDGTSENIP